jgi:hypothetical protein
MPAYYMMVAGLIGLIAVWIMRETAKQPLRGSPPTIGEADAPAAGRCRADLRSDRLRRVESTRERFEGSGIALEFHREITPGLKWPPPVCSAECCATG